MPQEDRVIEHHRREESRLSQGHALMNVRCQQKRILMQGDMDGQKARLTTGEVRRVISVGQWTKRKLCKKKKVSEIDR